MSNAERRFSFRPGVILDGTVGKPVERTFTNLVKAKGFRRLRFEAPENAKIIKSQPHSFHKKSDHRKLPPREPVSVCIKKDSDLNNRNLVQNERYIYSQIHNSGGHPNIPWSATMLRNSHQKTSRELMIKFLEGSVQLERWVINRSLQRFDTRKYFALFGVLWQIADTLEWLHSVPKIAQGDVSGTNIMVDNNLKVHLIDFGISSNILDIPNMCDSGKYMVTDFYSAPELYQGYCVDSQTDNFAFGRVTAQMLREEDSLDIYYHCNGNINYIDISPNNRTSLSINLSSIIARSFLPRQVIYTWGNTDQSYRNGTRLDYNCQLENGNRPSPLTLLREVLDHINFSGGTFNSLPVPTYEQAYLIGQRLQNQPNKENMTYSVDDLLGIGQ